ncbi:MAG TPA: KH domain-containing protein [Coriobacteriia bacterium]|nr:KH domain-containing protein [Coriobacteriia bacterium]
MTGTPDIDALVEYLVTSLVEHPDEVSIVKHEGASSPAYEITVHPDDTGKIIGRGGRVIKAIRVLVRAAASASGSDAMVDVTG